MLNGTSSHRNLVVVRAGLGSLHPSWLCPAESRSWDLLVSYYEAGANHHHPPDVRVVHQAGGKWDGLHQALCGSDIFERYDYVWLPDDDIATTPEDINRLFLLMREYDLAVGQPALTPESYFTHFLVLHCPGFCLRFTNYVEIMAPCLRSNILEAVHNDFAGSMSGFGLDGIWCRLDRSGRLSGVLDCLTMHHTRPVGTKLRAEMARAGIAPEDEEGRLRDVYGLSRPVTPVAYAGFLGNGQPVTGKSKMGLRMAYGYLTALPTYRDRRQAIAKIIQLVRRQITRPVDLSILSRGAPYFRRGGAAT